MKKRKELDALVTNGKTGKRKKGSESCSAHELLEHDSDSSEMDDFTILQNRKSRKKGGSPIPLSTICLPLCQFVLVTTCILVSGTLVWLHIGLREDLDILRAHMQKVETGNRNTPEELHWIHSKLRELDSNVTALLTEIKKNIVDIDNVTTEIKYLKKVTSSLQESIAAAPTIKNLPKDFNSLSEQVASFGSKITALESSTKELKDSQTSIQSTSQTLFDELDNIKNTVHELSNLTKSSMNDSHPKPQPGPIARDLSFQSAIQETKQRVSYLQQELFELTTSVEKMNLSLANEIATFSDLPAKVEALNGSLIWVVDEQNMKIHSLEGYVFKNMTTWLEHMDSDCCKDFDKSHHYVNASEVLELVNRTVTEAIVNIVYSDLQLSDTHMVSGNSSKSLVTDTYNGLLLMAGLLKQFSNVPQGELLTEKNASSIISQLLNNSFHDAMAEQNAKIETLEGELNKMNSVLSHDDDGVKPLPPSDKVEQSGKSNNVTVHSESVKSPSVVGTTATPPKPLP